MMMMLLLTLMMTRVQLVIDRDLSSSFVQIDTCLNLIDC
uniref:Uncharacterized protein n=1 Tax=Phakopsora pachyrhizi TaxID=170000 RepID=A0A0S1MIS5_PHAPC